VVGHLYINSFFPEIETDLNRARDFAAAQVQSHKWQDPNSLKMVVDLTVDDICTLESAKWANNTRCID
jgi:hypothetical protein